MNWKQYIEDCNKVGLESPIPYKVVPYKNGIGIKKTVFLKPKKIDEQQDHEGNIINNV